MDASQPHPMNAHAAAVTPVLRTVLLCDIVESTALVERLGDVRAVALLQKHDRLLREAMTFCHGQLIDKADGVLALFERPIQALDFALRYQRGLRELGQAEKLELQARIGIHVGDVMTWANEPKDVLAGAKAFEVEGLAKPVAARLMNLALPGQILMSGMAQNLCQRAAGELGEAGANLRWLMHGRYSFKGVPAPMLVHEVGVPGLSPLRAPSSGAKAWRELPLWRRPPVLAVEVLLVGVLGVALFWTTLRSEPAIAFAERDWVVVAQLQNRTDEKLFDDSLDTALRIGLEQSRHVNLVSQLQIDRALERMQRQGQPVDRQLAAELALREGAKAVILPTIAEVGGVVRVSLEVIDPGSGVTVYSESADAKGSGDVLAALDDTVGSIRSQLGEALASVESSSLPLDKVTTGNLEALRAFSLGSQARLDSRLPEAEALFQQAVALDPEFAMAYLRLAFMRYIQGDAEGTRRYLDKALAFRDKLTQREALFLEGAEATLAAPERALEKFGLLAAMYPEEYRAYYNYAYFAHHDLLRSADGLELIGKAIDVHNPARANAQYLQGRMQLAVGRVEDAIASFELAESMGVRGFTRDFVEAHAVRRDYAAAEAAARSQTATGSFGSDLAMRMTEVTLPLDRGDFATALGAAQTLETDAATGDASPLVQWTQSVLTLSLRSQAPDKEFAKDLQAFAGQQESRMRSADSLLRRHVIFHSLAAGWMAANTGDAALAERMLALVKDDPLVAAFPANSAMKTIVEAEQALASGDPQKAIAKLAPDHTAGKGLYHGRSVLLRAYLAAGETAKALAVAEWLASQRGRAFAETASNEAWQAINVLESNLALDTAARLELVMERRAEASARDKAFRAAWPDADDLEVVERRRRLTTSGD